MKQHLYQWFSNHDVICMPENLLIDGNGPKSLFSTLPVEKIAKAICKKGIPSELSHDAGTFVCNYLFYTAMQLSEKYGIEKCGFIHVPCIPSQLSQMPEGTSAMEEKDITEALNTAVAVTVM